MIRSFLLLMLTAPIVFAAEPAPKFVELIRHTSSVEFKNQFAYEQLIVSARTANNDLLDVTRLSTWEVPECVKVKDGFVRPVKPGSGNIVVKLNELSLTIPVKVLPFNDEPISFTQDIQPVLSKLGCNAGTCHGSAQGKNGFKLSLRGYDPIYDHRAFTDDLEGRRFNRAAPERSLMLMKPAGAVPHAGGTLWQPEDSSYELVRRWIAQGVKLDLKHPKVTAIQVFPSIVSLPTIGLKQQFRIIATYSDKSSRDVTAESFIESSNNEVATVDKTGLLTSVRRGEATMLARFEGAYSAASVVIMGDRSGFQWEQRPVNNKVDELVDAKLKKMQILASELCTDEEFLRRVYLDLTGLPPTADEVRKFMADSKSSATKRNAIVDQLVGSEAFIDHWTNKWGDMMQVNRKFLGDKGATALRTWIREAMVKNMPYDKFAYAILTASGSNVDNPPAAYYKILRTPDVVMENTTQLFLAIRFNCNKCHDHPFERWTQDQYYEMSAYFAQVNRKEDPKYKGQKIGGTAVEGAKPLVEVVEDVASGEITHERTGAKSPPKFPFTHTGKVAADKANRRVQAAQWITSPENPYFAKSFVNRVWSYMTGVGIIEPVDDIRAGNPATNPDLLDYLTAEFVKSGFDTQSLIKTICKSRTYQLSVKSNKWNKDDEMNYSHAMARRLPAEVLFDAIHKATGAQSKLPGLPVGSRAAQLVDGNIDLPGGFLELFGKPVRESACECERSNTMMLGPVLAMVNGPIVGEAIRDSANHIVKFTEKEKDDAKVIEEIYLSILNRKPTAKEIEIGIKALKDTKVDYDAIVADYRNKQAKFDEYAKTIDSKIPAYETQLKTLKPTEWVVWEPKVLSSKGGPTPATAKEGSAILKLQSDKSILVSGKNEAVEIYTVGGDAKFDQPITAFRLEVLPDDSLPAKGPGRSQNGNFVLSELTTAASAKADSKLAPVKLNAPEATFSQAQFPVGNAIDNNRATGWAISPKFGEAHTALFRFAKPIDAKGGSKIELTFSQEFGTGHTIGKFRISFTTDKNPKLASTVPAAIVKILDTPTEKRTAAEKEKLKAAYIASDSTYQQLQRDIPPAPPSDPRVLGAQDLAWALMNTPGFLFNR